MRRFAALLALASMLSVAPSPVAAAPVTCSVAVTPNQGGPTSTYRIRGHHFPATTDGSMLEVEIDVTRLDPNNPNVGPTTVFWLYLIPGGRSFYLDYNPQSAGKDHFRVGRYRALVFTPHQAGCRTRAFFKVNR